MEVAGSSKYMYISTRLHDVTAHNSVASTLSAAKALPPSEIFPVITPPPPVCCTGEASVRRQASLCYKYTVLGNQNRSGGVITGKISLRFYYASQ
jgi:hypothetical protein